MEIKRVVFDVAVYEVQMTDNWCAPDYAKEHFEQGVFIVHDGVNYLFCGWGGGSEFVYTVVLPNDVILGVMAKEIKKAEAFEYLKYKKVNAKGMVKEIQKKLFEIGYTWCDGSTDVFLFVGFFLIDDETFQFTESLSHFKNCAYEEISADDILSIEIMEEEDTSMPKVEFERYVKILQSWSKRINSSFVFSERGMGIVRGDLLTKLEGEEKGAYYKIEATL